MLLFIAGVELNPGPKIWICSVCQKRIGKTHASVRCNNWCHFLACSSLLDLESYNNNFVASCCRTTTSPLSPTCSSSPYASPISSTHSSTYATPNPSPLQTSNPSPQPTPRRHVATTTNVAPTRKFQNSSMKLQCASKQAS